LTLEARLGHIYGMPFGVDAGFGDVPELWARNPAET
jgi:hypothetical protein